MAGSGKAGSAEEKGAMDKEAFLQLLVAQMKHQDPLSPLEGTEYVAQLAQFTQVEQAMNQARSLELLSLQLTGIASNEAVSLIGKEVTVRGNSIAFDGTNATGFSVNLDGQATETTVTIRDANGNAVREMELGAKSGQVSVPWDGKDDNGNTLPAGNYTVEVSARDADGNAIDVSQDVTGTVVEVTFDKGYPELLLDSGARAPISDLIRVGIDDGTPGGSPPGNPGGAQSGANPANPSTADTSSPAFS
jgi:flagellar basal-body rod modification protein FlgD